jgi:hypothetical protein
MDSSLHTSLACSIVRFLTGPLDHGPAYLHHCEIHLQIGLAHDGVLFDLVAGGHDGHLFMEAAEIVFQEVNAPRSIEIRFLCSWPSLPSACTRLKPGRAIYPQLEIFAMHIVRECLHIRELLVGMEDALLIPCALPGIIDVDIDVSCIPEETSRSAAWRTSLSLTFSANQFQEFQSVGGVAASRAEALL